MLASQSDPNARPLAQVAGAVSAVGLFFALAPGALAQRGQVAVEYAPAAGAAAQPSPAQPLSPPASQPLAGGSRPVILLTGYWPPTNEMIRDFASDPALNSNWIGSDWEGRGYDVHAYFPEFNNPMCSNCGKGQGYLEVDYQDTVADFDALTALHQPVAIITFSRGFIDNSWEVEMNQINRTVWFGDFQAPFFPNPSPPDPSIAAETIRPSVHPVNEIVSRVAANVPGVDPAVCFSGDGGGYLSEFVAYLGVLYQDQHRDVADPARCVAAGHVHVGGLVPWSTAQMAAEETLRTVMDHVDSTLACSLVTRECEGGLNSISEESSLNLYGTGSITGTLTRLMADGLPPNQFGLFFYGQGPIQNPFGDGFLCVSQSVTRLPDILLSSVGGRAWMDLDFGAAPLNSGPGQVLSGSTWSFQYWYRDPAAGGAGFNTSDALAIEFCQ